MSTTPPPQQKYVVPILYEKNARHKKKQKNTKQIRALFCCINLKAAIFYKIVYLQKCVIAPLPYFPTFYKVQQSALFCCTFLIIKFRLMLMMFIKKNYYFLWILPYFVFFFKVQRSELFCCTFLIIKFKQMLIKKPNFLWIFEN